MQVNTLRHTTNEGVNGMLSQSLSLHVINRINPIMAIKKPLAVEVINERNDVAAYASIDRACRAVGSVQKALQHAASIAIGYVNVHGDISVANKCLAKLTKTGGIKGIKLQAWVTYLETFGALEFVKDSKVFKFRKEADVLRDPAALLVALAASPWQDAVADKPLETMHDCMKDVVALLKKLEKLAAAECEFENEFVIAGLEQLRDFVPKMIDGVNDVA